MPNDTHRRARDYDDTPTAQAERWGVEIAAAKKDNAEWLEDAERIEDEFLDERDRGNNRKKKVNLFTSTLQTQRSLVYGRTPEVEVGRAFADPDDDVARVAGELLERALNSDIQRPGDTYAEALGLALDDRQLRGQGQVRIRYEATFEPLPPPIGPVLPDAPPAPTERKTSESVAAEYVFYRDFLRSPARTEAEVRWNAFRLEMTSEDVEERWGKDVADNIPYALGTADKDNQAPNPWQRAEVWEIWDKSTRQVVWWVEGHGEVLETQEDPLQLAGFFPCPRPMRANPVTGSVKPHPDFNIAEDLYCEVNELADRIAALVRAVRATGVYDGQEKHLANILAGEGNKLYPVENYRGLSERGGLRGAIEMLPLESIIQAITVLSQQMEATKQQLYEVTGMSDLMRGQAAEAGATATEQRVKTRFASTRLRAQQEEFARFATEVQQLKAEVICRLFDDESITRMANVAHMAKDDAPIVPQALALLREDFLEYRVRVQPEAVAMADFAALTQEAMELVGAVTQVMQAAAPMLAQFGPGALPSMVKILKAVVARMKGADALEGILDGIAKQAEAAAAQPQQPAPPDQKLLAQQLKGKQEQEKSQMELRNDLIKIQAEVQADGEREANQRRENTQEALDKARIGAEFKQQPQKPGGAA